MAITYLTIETKDLPELILRSSPSSVNLITEDEDGTVGKLLVRQQRVKLNLGLLKTSTITRVNQEYNGIHGGKVITPYLEILSIS